MVQKGVYSVARPHTITTSLLPHHTHDDIILSPSLPHHPHPPSPHHSCPITPTTISLPPQHYHIIPTSPSPLPHHPYPTITITAPHQYHHITPTSPSSSHRSLPSTITDSYPILIPGKVAINSVILITSRYLCNIYIY